MSQNNSGCRPSVLLVMPLSTNKDLDNDIRPTGSTGPFGGVLGHGGTPKYLLYLTLFHGKSQTKTGWWYTGIPTANSQYTEKKHVPNHQPENGWLGVQTHQIIKMQHVDFSATNTIRSTGFNAAFSVWKEMQGWIKPLLNIHSLKTKSSSDPHHGKYMIYTDNTYW